MQRSWAIEAETQIHVLIWRDFLWDDLPILCICLMTDMTIGVMMEADAVFGMSMDINIVENMMPVRSLQMALS